MAVNLRPFLLDRWLDAKYGTAIDCDLGSSTGPVWKLKDLLDRVSKEEREALFSTPLQYSSAKGSEPLRTEIAALYNVSPEHVQITTGASEAMLVLFFLSQAAEGSNVVLPFPCFSSYQAICEGLNLDCHFYRLWEGDSFRVDTDEVRACIDDRTRLLVVNSPHNPTGATIPAEQMKELYDLAAEREILLVSDEVYHPIYHGVRGESVAEMHHAVVVSSMSKALSVSGTRVGWLVTRDEGLLARCFDARAYFTISNAPIAEKLATLALRQRESMFDRTQAIATENLATLDAFMARHAEIFVSARPTGGLTAFPRFRSGQDSRPFCEELKARRVLIVPGDCFGMPEHFRIGFGANDPAAFAQGMARIEEFLLARHPSVSRRISLERT
jgi:aspartate/methionine/tyrosine aminotransferase